jgi:hypothetical protein
MSEFLSFLSEKNWVIMKVFSYDNAFGKWAICDKATKKIIFELEKEDKKS